MNAHRSAIVYTRQGCHLCEEAEALLRGHGFRIEAVDIDCDRELQDRYGRCVPVVVIGGRERFRGRIDPILLRRLIAGLGL
ncbi:MAG: glutaredoxin family protein [Pirellulales bacterium]|nr:glutaredoxin family protein [Pirellulales bacterium]